SYRVSVSRGQEFFHKTSLSELSSIYIPTRDTPYRGYLLEWARFSSPLTQKVPTSVSSRCHLQRRRLLHCGALVPRVRVAELIPLSPTDRPIFRCPTGRCRNLRAQSVELYLFPTESNQTAQQGG